MSLDTIFGDLKQLGLKWQQKNGRSFFPRTKFSNPRLISESKCETQLL
jgi:hypothetical protein